jgi:hypothetical protein
MADGDPSNHALRWFLYLRLSVVRSMPAPVPWMTRTDRYVLDLLDRQGVVVPPKAIWLSLRRTHGEDAPSKKQISRRLRNELTEHGLVHQPFSSEERGYYELTELGERFLNEPDAAPTEFTADTDGTSK